MHSAEISCNDNKHSPMMMWHTAKDHDGPSTFKSFPLQSTGLGVMLIPSMLNANPTTQLLLPSCTCPAGVMFGCTAPVQVLLHVVCHCEDNQLPVLSPCITVLGVSQYGHCNLLPWPHLQSSCFLAACLRHVHADEQGPWASFFWCFSESVERPL